MYSIALYIVVAEPHRSMTATKVTNLTAIYSYEMCLVTYTLIYTETTKMQQANRGLTALCCGLYIHINISCSSKQPPLASRAAQNFGYDCIRHE
jgi:hypothetical protein